MAIGDNIKALAKRIETKGNDAVRTAAFEATNYAIFGTPVDVGEARSNWRVNIGSESTTVRPAYNPYPKLFSKEKTKKATDRWGESDANYSSALMRADAIIDKWKPSNEKSLFLSNPLDYLERLSGDPGYSLQPPSLRYYRWIKRVPFKGIKEFRNQIEKP